ncbi:hypothetical protein [Chlorogloeopsis sp. ULAP02]|uniref:hypothetical protein n=1 Tax=Chlorogloeopsis sp. ULAP02 TaxID=3107926 RepID=UPI00398AB3B5
MKSLTPSATPHATTRLTRKGAAAPLPPAFYLCHTIKQVNKAGTRLIVFLPLTKK